MTWVSEAERPSRYIGGERGQVVKDPSKLSGRMALAFPDLHEVAASHLGFRIVYAAINAEPDLAAERVFAPWIDVDRIMSERNMRLCSLETGTPLRDFDAIGFSLPYELLATGVLRVLDLAGIPLGSEQRSEHDPIVIAGGPALFNPEPYALFFDAVVLGDGELAAPQVLRAIGEGRRAGARRGEILLRLAGIDGVYVPSLYEPEGGDPMTVAPMHGAPGRIRRQILPDLDGTGFGPQPLVPFVRAVHDRLSVEICRGCAAGCRFCQAGYIYRPVRERSCKGLLELIESQLESTGYEELGLLSLSSGDYSDLGALLDGVLRYTIPRRIGLSLPSLRVQSLSDRIVRAIGRVHKTGFTMAVEAGTERLRLAINKPISEAEIVEAASRAFEAGWNQIKLYFMVGLPGETDDDAAAIPELALRVASHARKIRRDGTVTAHVAAFVPKPHTPFQWEPMIELDEAQGRLGLIKRSLDRSPVKVRWQDPRTSQVEAAISRGDRRVAGAIEAAFRSGACFDAWTERFDHDRWKRAFADQGLDLDSYARRSLDQDGPLAWDHVDVRVTREFLASEREAAQALKRSPDCRRGGCLGCGVCDDVIETRLAADEHGPEADGSQEYRPGSIQEQPQPVARMRFNFRKTGGARFLSHLELIAQMERAMRRAALPVAFSRGHHPKPRMSFSPPLSSGVESMDEYLDVLFVEHVDPQTAKDRLSGQMPDGLTVIEAAKVAIKSPSLFESVAGFSFVLRFAGRGDGEGTELSQEQVVRAVERFEGSAEWMVDAGRESGRREVDIKPIVSSLILLDDQSLRLDMAHRPGKAGVGPIRALSSIMRIDERKAASLRLVKVRTFFRGEQEQQ